MSLFSFIFLSLVFQVFCRPGRAGVRLPEPKSASGLARGGKCPEFFLQCPVVPVRVTFPFTSPRAGERAAGTCCALGTWLPLSWRSRRADWPSPREGHIMAAQPAGSFSTFSASCQRHPHSPLGW